MNVEQLMRCARAARMDVALAGTEQKNAALEAIACALDAGRDAIKAANLEDVNAARASGMRESLIDRLTLTDKRIDSAIEGVRTLIALPDPVGGEDASVVRPNGLRIARRRVPLGVVGIIYEARPNVTVDAASLCLKAGNVCVLRGGKEAIRSNIALAKIMREAVASVGLPADAVCLCEDTSRDSANAMMNAVGLLDVLIPRGGAGLIRAVVENAKVPVIETGVGICHIYCDKGCDHRMAIDIVENAKCSRPSVCNAAEVLIIHSLEAAALLPRIKAALDAKNVELRCDKRAWAILRRSENVKEAVPEDFRTEFLDYVMAVMVVDDVQEAIDEINAHGSGHSESIVTNDYGRARQFQDRVDAAAVYVNASTRFTDGFEFGFGGEIGISTQKLHARGPMGLEALTTIKYTIMGDGQVRR